MAQNAILNLVVALIFSFTAVPVIMAHTFVAGKACKTTDWGPVIHTTPLVIFLELVQKTAYKTYGHKGFDHFDPRLYVDLSLKNNLSITIQEFHKLPRTENGYVPVKELNSFIEKHFGDSEEDLVHVKPVDFVPEPKDFLPKVKSPEMRGWALEVHSLWSNLNRKISNGVFHLPDYHTLLPLKSPVIIPGSRFRLVYYWDSYWVISFFFVLGGLFLLSFLVLCFSFGLLDSYLSVFTYLRTHLKYDAAASIASMAKPEYT